MAVTFKKINADNIGVNLLQVIDPKLIRRWEQRYREMGSELFSRGPAVVADAGGQGRPGRAR